MRSKFDAEKGVECVDDFSNRSCCHLGYFLLEQALDGDGLATNSIFSWHALVTVDNDDLPVVAIIKWSWT